ncbi:Hypothetical predicted protein [Lecanosticta acicola]|uniref:DUF1772-domain-containing protein n=1 Tax=Lecanosticta acicola TaxID=111012 RepID=A0AAI8Z624_9PEZI|nr:Hypothetical predicted protein [Lecanosticta acicola]
MDLTTTCRFLSTPTAFLVAGYYASMSQNAVAVLLSQPPKTSLPLFSQIYHRGFAVVAPGALIATLAFAYLGYVDDSKQQRRNLYAAAAGLCLAPLILTRLVMWEGIQRLLGGEVAEAEAKLLLESWIRGNWVRAGLMVAAGGIGMVTTTMEG